MKRDEPDEDDCSDVGDYEAPREANPSDRANLITTVHAAEAVAALAATLTNSNSIGIAAFELARAARAALGKDLVIPPLYSYVTPP